MSERRCYYWTEPDTGQRIRIPCCYGAANHWGDADFGAFHCTCYPAPAPTEGSQDKRLIRELEQENARLQRIIFKLTKHKRFKK